MVKAIDGDWDWAFESLLLDIFFYITSTFDRIDLVCIIRKLNGSTHCLAKVWL